MADLETVGREVVAIEVAKNDPDPTYRMRPEIFRLEAEGLLAEKRSDFTGAEKLLRQAVALEDSLPVAFGPPTIDLPSRELLAAFLLRRGRRRNEARAPSSNAALATAITSARRQPNAAQPPCQGTGSATAGRSATLCGLLAPLSILAMHQRAGRVRRAAGASHWAGFLPAGILMTRSPTALPSDSRSPCSLG